jgi:GNAT superfamily N-acetyltransferase
MTLNRIDAAYTADELLRDGQSIHVRAIRPDDRELLREHFHHLSARSVRFRFFAAKHRLTEHELDRLTQLDFVNAVGLVATLYVTGSERIIGVGRYYRLADPPSTAEVAFAVLDPHQGRGIGTILLDHLLRIARRNGITAFEADVLGENDRMLEVFAKSGLVITRSLDAGVIHLSFPVEETEEALALADERHRQAAAARATHPVSPRPALVEPTRDRRSV